jgi:hypothetical protein
MPEKSFQIRAVRSAADLEAVVQLFNAYASAVGIDLGYQDFDKELATLPGKYERIGYREMRLDTLPTMARRSPYTGKEVQADRALLPQQPFRPASAYRSS